MPSHLYRKATLTPTHTRETHTRTHTHTSQTPLFSLLTANLSKRSAVGGGGKRTRGRVAGRGREGRRIGKEGRLGGEALG